MNRFAMIVVLLLVSMGTARAACNDPAAVASTRAAADLQCPCATAANHKSVVSGTNGNADNRFCSPSNTGCDNPPLSSIGAMYEHTFTQTGTFPYYCSVHFFLGMTGTITVQ